jgi:dual specificity protein kinase YAK1
VLTHPSDPKHNEGYDNENYDLILRVGDALFSDPDPSQNAGWLKASKYTVVDILGQGTFGQVVKCRSEEDGTLVAIKVLKNKSAYFKQGLYEIGILALLNTFVDPDNTKHTLRMTDHFLFHNHLCIVNELLSINIFELIKQNNFRGITLRLVQRFVAQLLDALIGLEEYEIIHCDLKPENILLESLNTSKIRLIDFGSACMEHAPQYSYIQSRHYRAPEVLLGLQY